MSILFKALHCVDFAGFVWTASCLLMSTGLFSTFADTHTQAERVLLLPSYRPCSTSPVFRLLTHPSSSKTQLSLRRPTLGSLPHISKTSGNRSALLFIRACVCLSSGMHWVPWIKIWCPSQFYEMFFPSFSGFGEWVSHNQLTSNSPCGRGCP